ncbi:non-homologous end-joining DNA ligase [Naumannella halotolerans]|uniref:Bifunctional non-homologous end joining protein LigD n=1 Tax=Naumannella halotolerans TaxID=993414 RepID=A0A4R7J8A0_9ACTN|nr:non-homologous end-joining DNA ligase [Naumannella halotolerans]TDT33710.1 bifunctional non-homologous end joining protein LigD [Naumannella halotolerans]
MARSETLTEIDGHRLSLSNLDKVLYPETGFTKAEVISYYLQIAPVLLPHLHRRPITRLRFPDGVEGFSFYEKNAPAGTPDWVPTCTVRGSEGPIGYVLADGPASLVWLANLAALELHVPQWQLPETVDEVTLPEALATDPDPSAGGPPLHDRLVVDLDPGEGMTMIELARAALLTAGALAADGLVPSCRTTGSKGLQVAAAIAPTDGQRARDYVRELAAAMVRQHPKLFVDQMAKAVRDQRIFLDYNQNQTFRNTIAPYSLRGRAEPRVATPVTWDEVAAVDTPEALRFGPEEVLRRVAKSGDLAHDLLDPDPPSLPA